MKQGKIDLNKAEAVWGRLGGEEGVERLLNGESEVITRCHSIDSDANPEIPMGWGVTIAEHRTIGQLELGVRKLHQYQHDKQKTGEIFRLHDLRKELENKIVPNANALDYFFKNQQLIPEHWKGKTIYFFGTIYRDLLGNLYVRYLVWKDECWCLGTDSLNNTYHDNIFALIIL